MRKDPKIFLKHIQESIERMEKHIGGMSEDEFENNIKTQDAVIRKNLNIISLFFQRQKRLEFLRSLAPR